MPDEEIEEVEEAQDDDDIGDFIRAGSTRGARIEIAKADGRKEYFWMMYAKNGRRIATSPKGYERLNDLKSAIESVRESIEEAPVIRLY